MTKISAANPTTPQTTDSAPFSRPGGLAALRTTLADLSTLVLNQLPASISSMIAGFTDTTPPLATDMLPLARLGDTTARKISIGNFLNNAPAVPTWNISQRLNIPATVAGKGPFGLDYGTALFNGTLDPVVSFGYNVDYSGAQKQAGEQGLAWHIEGDYNDGANHISEAYIQYIKAAGGAGIRPYSVGFNRGTETIIETDIMGPVYFMDMARASSFVFNTANGKFGIGNSSNLPVETLDVVGGNIFVRSLYPGDGATPATRRIMFQAIEKTLTRVGGAGFDVTYNRISDNAYGSTLNFYTANSNAELPRLTINNNGSVGIGNQSPLYQLEVVGNGQATAAITDAGAKGGMLLLYDGAGGAGNGGAVLFANGVTNGLRAQAAIKALLTGGGGNGIGDLAFSTRNATGDTALTERMRITAAGSLNILGPLAHQGATLGFYNHAVTAQQTGVAVTAAGIHAACVALGLFTA